MLTTCTVVAALALGSVSSASDAPAPAAVTTSSTTAPSYPCTNPDAALTGRDVVSSGVVHSGRVAGSTASEIASKINARAFESAGGATKPCADFSHAELDAIVSEVRVQFHRFRSTYSASRAGSSLSCSHCLQRISRSRARLELTTIFTCTVPPRCGATSRPRWLPSTLLELETGASCATSRFLTTRRTGLKNKRCSMTPMAQRRCTRRSAPRC
jgi:hypothetical protein